MRGNIAVYKVEERRGNQSGGRKVKKKVKGRKVDESRSIDLTRVFGFVMKTNTKSGKSEKMIRRKRFLLFLHFHFSAMILNVFIPFHISVVANIVFPLLPHLLPERKGSVLNLQYSMKRS